MYYRDDPHSNHPIDIDPSELEIKKYWPMAHVSSGRESFLDDLFTQDCCLNIEDAKKVINKWLDIMPRAEIIDKAWIDVFQGGKKVETIDCSDLLKVIQVPFAYQMYGRISVRGASTMEEAAKMAEEKLKNMNFNEMASISEYLQDSEEIDTDGVFLDENGNVIEEEEDYERD